MRSRSRSRHIFGLQLFKEKIEALLLQPTKFSPRPAEQQQQQDATNKKDVFFHVRYHPRGVQRKQIRTGFDATLGPLLPQRKLVVAISRDKNLRDRLCQTKLELVPGNNPSDCLSPPTINNNNNIDV